jgi:hypothetical protein
MSPATLDVVATNPPYRPTQQWAQILAALVICAHFATAGCSSTGGLAIMSSNAPPADWPTLKVVVHSVPNIKFRDVCAKITSPWQQIPPACAVAVFETGVCHIFTTVDFPPSAMQLRHERGHCAGEDHIGESTNADAWAAYKARKPVRQTAPVSP